MSVAYDVASDRYTLVRREDYSGGPIDAEAAFGPADLTDSNAVGRVYENTDGGVPNSLLLTNAGTSGELTYRYVGSGLWQRTLPEGSLQRSELNAFVYGIKTPPANIPRRGAAGYKVDLLGSMTRPDETSPLVMRGEGEFVADFALGDFDVKVPFSLLREDGTLYGDPNSFILSGIGELNDPESDALVGIYGYSFMVIYSQATPREYLFEAALVGDFYGPNIEEVGASFSAISNDHLAAGTIMGRQDAGVAVPSGRLVDLTETTEFSTGLSGFEVESSGGTVTAIELTEASFPELVSYDPASETFTFSDVSGMQDFGGLGTVVVGPSDLSDFQPSPYDNRYDVAQNGLEGYVTVDKLGEFSLSYSAFARIVSRPAGSPDGTPYSVQTLGFGLLTPQGSLPVAGTASYTGYYGGRARSGEDKIYGMGGEADFEVDFAALDITGTMDANIYLPDGNASLGTVNFAGSIVDGGAGGDIFGSFSGAATGSAVGQFFGPQAEEMMLNYHMSVTGSDAATSYDISGQFQGYQPPPGSR